MMNINRQRARRALDKRFDGMRPLEVFLTPPKGWIRAIRDALGMTAEQLGHRMDMRQQSLTEIERSEARGTIQLRTLRRAAEALDCQLVYALVPRDSLRRRVERRAIEIAKRHLTFVEHTMKLEDQEIRAEDREEQIEDYIREAVSERDLWDTP